MPVTWYGRRRELDKQGDKPMRNKVIIGLGLILVCGFIGSLIHIGAGSGMVIGVILFTSSSAAQ